MRSAAAAAGVQISQAASPLQTKPFRVVICSIKNSSEATLLLLLLLLLGSFICFRVWRGENKTNPPKNHKDVPACPRTQRCILNNTLHIDVCACVCVFVAKVWVEGFSFNIHVCTNPLLTRYWMNHLSMQQLKAFFVFVCFIIIIFFFSLKTSLTQNLINNTG